MGAKEGIYIEIDDGKITRIIKKRKREKRKEVLTNVTRESKQYKHDNKQRIMDEKKRKVFLDKR